MFLLAVVAGGTAVVALRLSLAMACLQFSIGAFNDLEDAPRDGGRLPPKPIPAGLVAPRTALAIGIGAAAAGLSLSALSGLPVLGVAAIGLGCGLIYDFALSRTVLSWMPLAIAIPLVPVYAWLGATGEVAAAIRAIVPIGALAGGGLAVANALVDIDVDRETGRRTVAAVLGATAAWLAQTIALGAAAAMIVAILPPGHLAARMAVSLGSGLLVIGIAMVRSRLGARRRVGWQVEAAGVAVLAIGWGLAIVGLA